MNAEALDAEKVGRIREGFLRKNSEYQKVTTTVVSLATATFALPIFFFKEVFGIKLDDGQSLFGFIFVEENIKFVTVSFLAYFSLFLSIYNGLYFTFYSGDYARHVWKASSPEDVKVEEPALIGKMNSTFDWSIRFFLIGLPSMVLSILLFTKTGA